LAAGLTRSSNRWLDPEFVRAWDRRGSSPLRTEQLEILATVVKDGYRPGSRILDLGCGSGKVEKLILESLPGARFTCVDRSPAMLDLAQARLRPIGERCRDRIATDNRSLCGPFRSVLGRLQRIAGADSGECSSRFADPKHASDEHPATLEQYFRWLRQAGLNPGVLHLHFHKALIAATRSHR